MAARAVSEDEEFILLAIREAEKGVKEGQAPFGAVITRNGEIIARAHNEVWKRTDITAHAEVIAIRKACRKLKTLDLQGCTIYSSTEPCPMCFSAIHWARIRRIVYGTSIADAEKAGFSELSISDEEMNRRAKSGMEISKRVLAREAGEVFKAWKKGRNPHPY